MPLIRAMTLNPSLGIALYTDGSSSTQDRSGGWAYVAVDAFDGESHAWGQESNTTNNRMEMQAVVEGLMQLAMDHGPIEVLVRSDSEYVVLGATNPLRSRRKNREMWEAIDMAIDLHHYVEFEHVRGHEGNHYNEVADTLAGQARKGIL